MGTRNLLRIAVGICIFGAVTAQYPYNSLYRGQEKDEGRYRPQLVSPSSTENPNAPKFAKIMKQINKVNDDGSYTFGYEADDGSFRVETRTKDGLVKGKYGFLDGDGKLKVTEYTAGEKSDEPERQESEEDGEIQRPQAGGQRSLPLASRPQSYAPRPQQQQPPRHYVHASAAPYVRQSSDQSAAAQTNNKVARAPPTTEDDFTESNEDDSDAFARRQSQSQEQGQGDNLNGQYFRASVTPGTPVARPYPSPSPNGISAAGRPIPGQGAGPYSSGQGAPQGQYNPSGFAPSQYNFGAGVPQGFDPQGAQFGPSGPGQYPGSPQDYQQGAPPPGFQSGSGFRRLQQAPQDFSSIGSPRLQGVPQNQQQTVQQFGGPASFGGFNTRQGPGAGKDGNSQTPNGEQYIPSVELDGYSEDLDEDGYPDEPPKDGKFPSKAGSSGGPGQYRPSALGPQSAQGGGALRGVQPGRGQPGTQLTDEQFQQLFNQGSGPGQQSPSGASPQGPQGQLILQLGPQGQVPGRQLGGGGGEGFPGGIQQQPGQQGAGGLPPQYVGQQQFGGFPQGGPQGFQGGPQGFPQTSQGFPQTSQGFPSGPQGFPQGSQGFPQTSQGFPQTSQGFSPSFGQGFGGQSFENVQGFPQSANPAQFGQSGSGNPLQGEGFPFDYSPFGGATQGFQGAPGAQGFQGAPGGQGFQGAPGGQGFQGAPGAQGFPSGAGQQYQGFPGQQGSYPGVQQFGGFPGSGPQGLSSGAGRFPGAGSPANIQQLNQSYLSGAQFPGPSPSPSSSPAETKKP